MPTPSLEVKPDLVLRHTCSLSYLIHSSSTPFTRSSTPLSRPSAKPLRVPLLHLHGLRESSAIAPLWLHPESCVHPQCLPVDHSVAASPEIYGFTDPNPAYSYKGVFVSDGPVLPPPIEMEPEEGYALREWRRLLAKLQLVVSD
ncbi:hypothetical protein Fmac_029718 [Flemingia macrophylla]|uniref:Uncharacterized protein n=1 Tax=Flemingia macrophylla TaxID=520843 RepID=A0ABD1LB64_9FABA